MVLETRTQWLELVEELELELELLLVVVELVGLAGLGLGAYLTLCPRATCTGVLWVALLVFRAAGLAEPTALQGSVNTPAQRHPATGHARSLDA